MRIRNFIESHSRYGVGLRILAILMCLLLCLSLVNVTLRADAEDSDSTDGGIYGSGALFKGDIDLDDLDLDLNDSIHIIIRHWHAEDDPSGRVNENAGSGDQVSSTVIVGAYIVPDANGIIKQGTKTYSCYARAYTSDQEKEIKRHHGNYVKVDEDTASSYIDIEDNKVSFFASPFRNGDTYYEHFSGFSVSAGQTAVEIDNGKEENFYADAKLIVNPAKLDTVHLIKSHLYYTSELLKVDGSAKIYDGDSETNFPNYVDTYTKTVDGKTTKYYNSNTGLHTDKTATLNKKYNDGRTFDLTLESWYNDEDPINVGMVLDASGSMGFTANTPEPIQVINKKVEKVVNGKVVTEVVRDYYKVGNTTLNKQLKNNNSAITENDFLTNDELAKIMSTRKTDNSAIRSSGYTYFIYDARKGTEEFTPLAYWGGSLLSGSSDYATKDGKTSIGQVVNNGGAGWYYVNPSGNWDTNYFNDALQSGKTINGIPFQTTITDNTKGGDKTSGQYLTFTDKLPGTRPKAGATETNTNRTYTTETANKITPSRFYIDAAGYLRCFYHVNGTIYDDDTKGWGTSFVYENNDQDYIKVEALQRALGTFITGLDDKSPDSLVSAVRFSTPRIFTSSTQNNLDNLVLLDWTADVRWAQQLISGQRGEGDNQGKAKSGTKSDNIDWKGTKSDFVNKTGLPGVWQYNYGLTGSTSTKQGLNAFYGTYDTANKYNLEYRLDQYIKKTGTNGKKYIIVFTDGKDTDLTDKNAGTTGQDAVKTANALKEKGYTILSVMLTGGPVQKGKGDYDAAHAFLESISGAGIGSGVSLPKYVFSTQDEDVQAELQEEGLDASDTVDALVKIFNGDNGILAEITNDLSKYNVQDYIDPRFDIVDSKGNTWRLNADGTVVVNDDKYDLSGNGKKEITLASGIDLTEKALKAELHYDSSNKMYYLVWLQQTIPGNTDKASKIAIWRGKVTVRAKDDFLGGNAILSNGNAKNMNMVYKPDSNGKIPSTASSATDKSTLARTNNPSKGFPRTTVNVIPNWDKDFGSDELYMGESFPQGGVIQNMINKASRTQSSYYYWEYIERYLNYYNDHLDKDGKLTVDLPLPVYADGSKIEFEGELTFDILKDAIFGKGLKLPYGYLPNAKASNQTGTQRHELDIIGYLTYSIDVLASEGGSGNDYPPTYDDDVIKDTIDREYDLNVSYEPLDACDCTDDCEDCSNCTDCAAKKLTQRRAANENLVVEKTASGEPVYSWNRGYKGEVGNYAEDEMVKGGHTVTIVGGEIALQVQLSKKDIEVLETLGITQITYKADLIRFYEEESLARASEGKQKSEVVGTFTAIIDAGEFAKIKSGETNLVLAGISYNSKSDYDYAKYGLPIGSYALSNYGATFEGTTKEEPFVFNNPYIITDSGEYTDPVFDLDQLDGSDNPNDYIANLDEDNSQIILGQEYTYTEDDGTTTKVQKYLDTRFGLFRVRGHIPSGNLSIKKTVEGFGKKDKNFKFNIVLTPPDEFPNMDLADDYTYTGSKNGTITFTGPNENGNFIGSIELKHNESITIKEIPEDVKYTITESDNEGYVVTSTNEANVIIKDDTQKVAFVNTPISMIVTKRVLGDPLRKTTGNNGDKFKFELTLKNKENENITDTLNVNATILKYSTSLHKWFNEIDRTKSVTVSTDDNGLLLSGNGSDYVVYSEGENETKVDYYLYVENKTAASITTNGLLSYHIDVIKVPVADVDADWSFDEETYKDTISNYTVYMNTEDKIGNELDGLVKLNYTAISKTISIVNGVAKFELSDSEGLQFSGLVPGTTYTVTEVLEDGSGFNFGRVSDSAGNHFTLLPIEEREGEGETTYSTYSVEGIIPEGSNAEVHYFNVAKDFTIPLSGGASTILYVLLGGLFLAMSGAVVIILSTKRRRRLNYTK